jgi:hypothetical protein
VRLDTKRFELCRLIEESDLTVALIPKTDIVESVEKIPRSAVSSFVDNVFVIKLDVVAKVAVNVIAERDERNANVPPRLIVDNVEINPKVPVNCPVEKDLVKSVEAKRVFATVFMVDNVEINPVVAVRTPVEIDDTRTDAPKI